jgi:hypothetical protein
MTNVTKHLTLILSFIALAISGKVSAADLVVQESGPVGTYASIGAAVAASTDGDRIIINNTVSGFPWTEDILINKTLTFLSAADNQRFVVQGNYTLQHAPGREITIIGMDNVAGSISSNGNGGTSRTLVNIMWCKLSSGNVNVNHDYFELNMASCLIENSGDISFRYGKVIGNQLSNGQISVTTDALAGIDSVHIVGNTGLERISCNSTSHYLYVSNNSISSTLFSEGIGIFNLKVGTGTNVIRNNSIRMDGYCIRVSSGVDGNLLIYNNILVDFGTADYGIWIQSVSLSNLVVSYNFIDNSFDNAAISGIVNDGTNTISGSVGLNADGSSSWTGTIDGGNPGTADYDLDLTRNDPGAYGGSYSLDNFFPIDGTSSKVFYLQMPNEILVGGSNSVTGHSFDR